VTKKDVNAIVKGAAVGTGLFLLVWWGLRRVRQIREINPALVKWEGK